MVEFGSAHAGHYVPHLSAGNGARPLGHDVRFFEFQGLLRMIV
jgi:hypothetical protein